MVSVSKGSAPPFLSVHRWVLEFRRGRTRDEPKHFNKNCHESKSRYHQDKAPAHKSVLKMATWNEFNYELL